MRTENTAPPRPRRRRGVTMPLIAVTIVTICGFVALAVDVGRVALARVQVQSAADVAAMAGARTLNGVLPQDLTAASASAVNSATSYKVLGAAIPSSGVTVKHGTYRYDTTNKKFGPAYALNAGELYNLTQVTVSLQSGTTFARIFGASAFTVSGTGTAAHGPRDVAVVIDYSGSMNDESDLWNSVYFMDNGQAAPNNTNFISNNTESVYPKFGHYSNEKNYSDYTNYANLLCPAADASNALTGNTAIGKCNVSISTLGIPALVSDFWSNARGASAAGAFAAPPDANLDAYNQVKAASGGGDQYLHNGNAAASPFAPTLFQVNGNSTTKNGGFESKGYKQFNGLTPGTLGYIQGPRYWGKTFFIWPPDPTNDWRQKFFGNGTATATAATPFDNTKLWDSSGNWLDPSGNYTINYKNILAWIKTAPNAFPAVLRSGNTLFYDTIPIDVPAASYVHAVLNTTIVDPNQRFWKEYIDYALGVWRDPYGNVHHPETQPMSYGPDYTFGTIQVTAPPGGGKYMDYKDNPERPRHRMWFGPMTMIQFMSDTGLLPGTTHDIAMYPMKTGLGGAIQDIQANHPNDLVAVVPYNRPVYNDDPPVNGAFNVAQYSLSTNYQGMIDSLWVPPNSGSSDVRPWDANAALTPRSHNDFDSNTASCQGLMLAYNQLSSSSTLRALDQGASPGVGGLGRVGAQRVVIYETDGLSNINTVPALGFNNGGVNDSYYNILPGQTMTHDYNTTPALFQVAQNICNKSDGTSGTPAGYASFTPNLGYPGYATASQPASIECLAFGVVFELPSATQAGAVSLLQTIAGIGGTTFPSSASDPTDGYRWCTGTITQRETKLRQAFTNIMNKSVPIKLIQ